MPVKIEEATDGRKLIIVNMPKQSPEADAPLLEIIYQMDYPEDGLKEQIAALTAILQDWLNFSIDVKTSDFGGMEWLEALKDKTQAALKEDV